MRTYVWGKGIDNLLSFTDHATSNTYYAIKDHQNTVIALTDDTGSIVESYEYDAYGNTKIFDASGTELTTSVYGNRYCLRLPPIFDHGSVNLRWNLRFPVQCSGGQRAALL